MSGGAGSAGQDAHLVQEWCRGEGEKDEKRKDRKFKVKAHALNRVRV